MALNKSFYMEICCQISFVMFTLVLTLSGPGGGGGGAESACADFNL